MYTQRIKVTKAIDFGCSRVEEEGVTLLGGEFNGFPSFQILASPLLQKPESYI